MSQSSELRGGAGFSYEGLVASTFLAALLTRAGQRPLNISINTVKLQQSPFGSPLDDIIIVYDEPNATKMHIQVKRSLRISAAKTNKDFREIIVNSWKTFKAPSNRDGHDHYGGATDTISRSSIRKLRKVTQAAQHSHDEAVFFSRNKENDTASKDFDATIKIITTILSEAKIKHTNLELFTFLKKLVILEFDVMVPESNIPSNTINELRHVLQSPDRAPDLWHHLNSIARAGGGQSATYSQASLKALLHPLFTFKDLSPAAALATSNSLVQNLAPDLKPTTCDIAISYTKTQHTRVALIALITTNDPTGLAQEIKSWKYKIERSPFLNSQQKASTKAMSLTQLFERPELANIVLHDLATTSFSAYIYYGKVSEGTESEPDILKNKLLATSLLHRLSKKSETTELIHSEIERIHSLVETAKNDIQKKYHRALDAQISKNHNINRKELIELADLTASIVADHLNNEDPTSPQGYIGYIKSRIRYGENIISGEKHKRDRNPLA